MRYPPHILDEIKARLPVSTVVGRKVRLKKAGREWKGLSPFNAEKTPSFYANDVKQFYHCFSSGKSGDIFTFLTETEGLSFPEAVERLAGEAGVDLPRASEGDREAENRRRSLHEVCELACRHFSERLAASAGREAREYLARRGIDREAVARFRLGYAPRDRHGLRDHLAAAGVPADAMLEAGLLVGGEDVAVPFDRFRDRVMFPIEDGRGRVVAFGGRAMRADAPAKYLNSPETPLFSKGRLLYNLHRARGPAQEHGTVLVAEGYVDVIALAQAGFPHAVAPLGTALTEDQLGLLWRLADEPVLCLDGDAAGRRAAFKAVDVALPVLQPGKSLRFALLPDGQDPDDLARAGGREAVERVLAGARPLADMLWLRETEAAPADTPERRAAFAARLREAVAAIRDETLRRFYRDEVEGRLWSFRREGDAREVRRGGARGPAVASTGYLSRPLGALSPALAGRLAAPPSGAAAAREAFIAAGLAAHPDALAAHADEFAALEIVDRDARAVADLLLDCALHDEAPSAAALAARLERAGLDEALGRLRGRVPAGLGRLLDPAADPAKVDDALRQAFTLQRKFGTLHSQLKAAERALSDDPTEANLAWLVELQAELATTEGAGADGGDAQPA